MSAPARPRRSPSIRRQLVLRVLFPLVTVMVLSAVVAYRVALDFADLAYDRSLHDSALDLSRRLRLVEGRVVVDVPAVALEMIEYDEYDRVYYQVRSTDDRFVMGQRDLPSPPQARSRRPVYYDGSYQGQRVRLVALYVPVDPEDDSALALVIVAETVVKRQLLANEILAAVALSEALLILLACVSVYVGVGHGLAPLDRLRRQIESRSHRDLNPLDEPRTPREVRPLVHAINELMSRLQRALSAQSRFVADAAHQLRTPLSGLKMHAELALRETSLEGVRARLAALVAASDRSAHLAHQLLALARAEPDAAAGWARESIDLDTLAREVTTDWVPRALARSIDLGFAGAAARVQGNAVMLRELLSNLIDNAVRYNASGGHVTVSLERAGDRVLLAVEDDGPGIPADARERVFERFQRLAENAPAGCGLGLAIVREIAEAHGARVTIETPASGAGTRVQVSFAPEADTPARD